MKPKTAASIAIGFILLSCILLFAASNGGAWESARLMHSDVLVSKIAFGLAHAKLTIGDTDTSVSYDDLVNEINTDAAFQSAFKSSIDDVNKAGKAVSGMIALAGIFSVFAIFSSLFIVFNRFPKIYAVAPISTAFAAFFTLLCFSLWGGKCHPAIQSVESVTDSENKLTNVGYDWCFGVCVAAFFIFLPGLILNAFAYNFMRHPFSFEGVDGQDTAQPRVDYRQGLTDQTGETEDDPTSA